MALLVRPARPTDEADLARIDLATWTPATSPAPPPAEPAAYAFFDERTTPADVLVAELDGVVAGYVKLRPVTPLPSNAHVLQICGLGVDPARQGHGAGRALIEAAVRDARARGARKLTLRVLGHNAVARRLYERCGFGVEGVQVGEFLLGGAYVDDVLMARHLTDPGLH
jgi:ribosomal protein S18 acetylase RimI-like enzyme